jgi:mono/diheme cytochrome c family protein
MTRFCVALLALCSLAACDPNPTPEIEKDNPWVPYTPVAANSNVGGVEMGAPMGGGEAPSADCPEGALLSDWKCLKLPEGLPPMAARWSGPVKGFATLCATCHGPDGRGNDRGRALGAKDLTSDEVQKKDDAALTAVITNGSQNQKMAAFGEALSPALIQDLVAHIRTLPSKNIKAPF